MIRLATIVISLLVFGAAYAQAPPPPAVPAPSRPGPPQKGNKPVQGDAAIPFKLAGARSGVQQPRFAMAKDEKSLASLLKEHNPHGEFDTKAVDFKKYDVVAYFVGSKPTGGYSVELSGVDRTKDGATVKFRLMKPGKGSVVTQAFTSPFIIQAVEKLPARVKHTVVEQERT